MLDGPALAPGIDLGAVAERMRASHVGGARVSFYWSDLQPEGAALVDFSAYDPVVLAAARAGIPVLPVILRTPAWAAEDPDDPASPPADPEAFRLLLTALAERYGPDGTLWAANPAVAAVPIRRWQVWNEPGDDRFWAVEGPWAPSYVRLLKAAHLGARAADPGARIVSAGLSGRGWRALDRIYDAGAGPWVDVAGLHPFGSTVADVVRHAESARKVLRSHGAGRTPLLLTEVTWSSGMGYAKRTEGFEETEEGQAGRLRRVLPALAGARKRLRIAGLYWYTWASRPLGSDESFDYCGLLRATSMGGFVEKPALAAWRRGVEKLTR